MVVSGRCCRVGTLSQAVHTLWLDLGLGIHFLLGPECASQPDAELLIEGLAGEAPCVLASGLSVVLCHCLWLCIHSFER